MIKNANDGLRQHYADATGGDLAGGNFGVKPMDACKGYNMGSPAPKMLKDGERGAGMPVKHTPGKMPSQAQIDHGPHMAPVSGERL
jgi:hypothetical protein